MAIPIGCRGVTSVFLLLLDYSAKWQGDERSCLCQTFLADFDSPASSQGQTCTCRTLEIRSNSQFGQKELIANSAEEDGNHIYIYIIV